MRSHVLGFQEIHHTQVAVVGGKGAHLGELSRIAGLRVPAGFCVTTDAFERIMAEAPSMDDRLDRLSRLKPDDREEIRALSAEIRRTVEEIGIPDDLAAAITGVLARLGEQAAYAVRSSATAEDLPTASFAGQQDTYLNVVGPAAILQHVSRCWASLFTERAVTYRLRNGVDHRKAHMAVVVQRMVFPQVAGILFTADPLTGNRKVASVEASFGLGEALVSGLVNADVYKVRDDQVIARTISAKQLAIHASPAGGTQKQAIEPERQEQPALTDAQVVRLAQLGRRIEAHFGAPQDIEWCLVDDGFHFVQSRPITTLFPPGSHHSLTEVLVNRLSQGRSFVDSPRRAVQMHHQGPGLVHRQIPCPVDDEFLGSRVEIALTERRRIDRVEELSQLCDADLYDLAALRESVPSGRPRLRRHLSSWERIVRRVDNNRNSLGTKTGRPDGGRRLRFARRRSASRPWPCCPPNPSVSSTSSIRRFGAVGFGGREPDPIVRVHRLYSFSAPTRPSPAQSSTGGCGQFNSERERHE